MEALKWESSVRLFCCGLKGDESDGGGGIEQVEEPEGAERVDVVR